MSAEFTYDGLMSDVACDLFKHDISIDSIASDLAVTKTSVCRRLRDKGIDIFSSCRTRGSVDGNVSIRKAIDFLGISNAKIRRIARSLSIQMIKPGKNKVFYSRGDIDRITEEIEKEYTPVFREGNPLDLSWLGGFFDGEGHISLRVYPRNRKSIVPDWEVCNTERTLVDRVVSIVDSLGINHTETYRDSHKNRKECWNVGIKSVKGFAEICHALSSYSSGIKRKRMELGFEWAMKHLALCAQSGDKFNLACEYSAKFEELK